MVNVAYVSFSCRLSKLYLANIRKKNASVPGDNSSFQRHLNAFLSPSKRNLIYNGGSLAFDR